MQLGLNWPLGPLSLAEKLGAGPAVELLEELEREHGGAYAQAPLLRRAAEQGVELRDVRRTRLLRPAAGTSIRPRSTSSSPRPARPSG